MLKMVDGTGIIGVDMVCPLGGAVSPPQPPNYDKVEMEGVGSLTLLNSLKAPLERVELIGNSVQPTTTGKNLFDPKQLQGISGFTIEGNEITQSGYNVSTGKTLKQLCPEITPGTYILSANNGDFTGLFGITKPMYKKSEIEIVDEDLNRIVALVWNPNKTIKYTLQIEKGNTVTPYEPYTGLKPSPSPEYPQEIKSAGKWNEEKQKYEIDVKVTNSEQGWTEEQTLTLTSDRPLTKWDKLVEQGGQYGWLYQSAAKEYIGDNSVELYDTGFYFKLSDKKIVNGEGYCKELKQYVNREENPCIAFNMSANIYAYTLNTQEIYGSTVSETKEYLKTHPLHLAYKTETTEFVPLPESEQMQLRNLHSYNGTTNIMVDSGEVPCGIKLTYRKEK